MGLIKALLSSTSSSFGDQFKEFVDCPSMAGGVLVQKGTIHHGSGNKNYTENLISNGSKIVVPEGTAMMIVDNGAIKEFTAEAGEYTWDSSSESSIFTGGLGKGLIDTFKTIGKRFSYGGQAAKDQRVYYVNLLTITGNKFGSPQPKKITDEKYGMLEVTFFGEYAFKVENPMILVETLIGTNPNDRITYDEIVGSQLKAKFIEQLTQAISIVMRKHKVSFGDLGMYGNDLSNEMNNILASLWKEQYGLSVTDVAINDINLTDDSMERVNKIDDATIFSNANLQSGLMASASAEAMKNAASNEGGAMVGFMGMNMANQAGTNMMGAVSQNTNQTPFGNPSTPEPGTLFNHSAPEITPDQTLTSAKKFCSNCGTEATGKFCSNCGKEI